MTRLVIALSAALLATTSAQAAVRYDFTGTLNVDSLTGPGAAALAANAGLGGGSGVFSGFVIFDSSAPDLDPDPVNEVYLPTSYGLNIGSYAIPAVSDFVFGQFDGSGFLLGFSSAGLSGPDADFLSLNISFPALMGGVLQNPALADIAADFTLSLDDSNVAASGSLTSFTVTDAPIPEPATWSLMIAGFGLVGWAARRRPQHVAYSVS